MAYSVLLHDERVSGNTPDLDDTTGFTVEETDPIDRILGWVGYCHKQKGQIEDLKIICHGYVSATNGRGGHGLELGKDEVHLSNVNKWVAIRGMANYILVYACRAADVDPAVSADIGNGKQLCSKLAAATGATVFAAVRTQYYDKRLSPWHWREIDMGDWEGPVYTFRPDGTVTNISPWVGDD
jgi:hypothetical protein